MQWEVQYRYYKWVFRWEWSVVRVALELVPTPVDMLSSDIPQGTAEYTRDGVFEHLSYCSGMVC